MSSERKDEAPAKQEPAFMGLRDFFSGYLHQDFRDEYGSAVAAALAFCKDARPDELTAVRKEWNVWRTRLDTAAPDAAATAIRKLGGAWQPHNLAELDDLGRVLNGE